MRLYAKNTSLASTALGFATICVFLLGTLSCKGPLPQNEFNQGTPISGRWTLIGPGGGGATFIPTFSFHNPSSFFIRCDMTGTYLTKDGGLSYAQFNFANGASSFAFDHRDSNILYVGSAMLNKSVDGGRHWDLLFPSPDDIEGETYSGDHASYQLHTARTSLYDTASGSIRNIRPDPLDDQMLCFSMGKYFYYTGNGGKNWQRRECAASIDYIYTDSATLKEEVLIFSGHHIYVWNKQSGDWNARALPAEMQPAFSFTGGLLKESGRMILYALHHDASKKIEGEFGYSEIWKSTDKGTTWQKITDTIANNLKSGSKPSYSMIACAELDAATVYVVTNRYMQDTAGGKLYWYGALKSSDAGESWQWCWKGGGGSGQYGIKDGKDVQNLEDAWVASAFGGEYIRLMDVGVSPVDGNTAIVTDWYRTMKTIDGGKTWKQVYSQPGSHNSYGSRGLEVTTTYGVHIDPFDSNHIAASYTDIGYHHSFDGGKTWQRSANGVPSEWVNTCYWVVYDPAVKNKMWSAWSGMHDYPRGKMTRDPLWKEKAKGGVCISEDGGKNWQPQLNGLGRTAPVTSLVLDTSSPAGNRVLYAAVYNQGVFKSTDDGKTWSLKNKGIGLNTCAFELTLTANGSLYLVVTPVPVHAGGKKGRNYYPGAVYKSTDGAENWQLLHIREGLVFPNAIEADPLDPEKLFLSCWADIDLSDLIGGDIARATGGNEQIKTAGGVYLSTNGGASWKQIFDSSQYVYDVAVDPRIPGRLYLNTFNKAAYRSDDGGNEWHKIKGYDFHWGQRPVIDPNNKEKIYLTSFGSGLWWGYPDIE